MKYLERRDCMRRMGRRILSAVLAFALCLTWAMPMKTEAKVPEVRHTPDWTKTSAVWQVSDGVTAYIKDGVLYFEGNGVIPDYTNDNLADRPWHTSIFGTVVVGAGITDIGTRAFAEFKNLRYFFIPSTTFVSNSTVFHKIDSKPVIRIQGSEETTRMIGEKIPYTSLDSWAAVAQSTSYNTVYIVDNGTVKTYFRQKTYPNIERVFSADNPDIDQPTRLTESDGEKLPPYQSPLRFAPGYEVPGQAVTTKMIQPGVEYLNVIAYYLNHVYPGYSYGNSYSNMVTTGDKIYEEFSEPRKYQLQIPARLQSPGREFKVIQLVDGQPEVLEDMDDSDTTITFMSARGTFSYSIIYK